METRSESNLLQEPMPTRAPRLTASVGERTIAPPNIRFTEYTRHRVCIDLHYNLALLHLGLNHRRPPGLLDHLDRHARHGQILHALHRGRTLLDGGILLPLRDARQPLALLEALANVALRGPGDFLFTVPDGDVGVVESGDVALEEDEVEGGVDPDDG